MMLKFYSSGKVLSIEVLMIAWSSSVIEAKLVRRYKRFFVDVEIDGKVCVAHCANTGSLTGAWVGQGQLALVTRADNPERKLQFTLQAIAAEDGSWIGVNTSYPNALIAQAFDLRLISDWRDFVDFQAEVYVTPETRLDARLINERGQSRFVEVKNVSMRGGVGGGIGGSAGAAPGIAMFPDSVSTRAQKHLLTLIDLVEQGFEAECLFIVQRTDCQIFSPASTIDPEYSRLLSLARHHHCETRRDQLDGFALIGYEARVRVLS
jgi:sugar fermentation stimulation protein A